MFTFYYLFIISLIISIIINLFRVNEYKDYNKNLHPCSFKLI